MKGFVKNMSHNSLLQDLGLHQQDYDSCSVNYIVFCLAKDRSVMKCSWRYKLYMIYLIVRHCADCRVL